MGGVQSIIRKSKSDKTLHLEDSIENNVPDFALRKESQSPTLSLRTGDRLTGNTKPELKVFVVMSKMVFLHLFHVLRKLRMV